MTKIYGILDTELNEFLSYNSKCGWTKVGNAKNAWTNANNGYGREHVSFNEQTRYVVVDLTEAYFRLEDLKK